MTPVLLIDDHTMIREGLKSVFSRTTDWNVAAEAGSLTELKQILSEQKDAVSGAIAIVDIRIGADSGFDALTMLSESALGIKSLVYSMFASPGYAMEALQKGAAGYITKEAAESELLHAMEEIRAGRNYIQQSLVTEIAVTANLVLGLTKKEHEIYEMVKQGYSNKDISSALSLNLRTVENYISKIYDKLGVTDRKELVMK